MFGNPAAGLEAMGKAQNRDSTDALHIVIDALKEDVPINDMAITSRGGKKIPLDMYLSTIKRVGEIDEFFLGSEQFNIWKVLPEGIIMYHDALGMTIEEAGRALKRFNQYTWNEYETQLREKYMWALKKTQWVADPDKHSGWTTYYDNPKLSDALIYVTSTTQLEKLSEMNRLRPLIGSIEAIEKEIDQIPPEKFFEMFTKRGRANFDKRISMQNRLEPLLKAEAQKAIDPLRALGNEYRQHHITKYYPEETQLRLF